LPPVNVAPEVVMLNEAGGNLPARNKKLHVKTTIVCAGARGLLVSDIVAPFTLAVHRGTAIPLWPQLTAMQLNSEVGIGDGVPTTPLELSP